MNMGSFIYAWIGSPSRINISICMFICPSLLKIMDWFGCVCACVCVCGCVRMSERRAPPSDPRGRSALILINIQGALTLDGSKVDYWHLGNQEWSRRELNYTNTTLICPIRSWRHKNGVWVVKHKIPPPYGESCELILFSRDERLSYNWPGAGQCKLSALVAYTLEI